MANPRLTKVKAKAKKARAAKRKANRGKPKTDIFTSSLGSVANIVKKRRLKKKKS